MLTTSRSFSATFTPLPAPVFFLPQNQVVSLWRPLERLSVHQAAVLIGLVLDPTVGSVIWLQAEEGGDKWTANFLQVASGYF